MVLTVFQNRLTRHVPTRQAKAITDFLSINFQVEDKSLFGFLHNVVIWWINGIYEAFKPNPGSYKAKDLYFEAESTILVTTQVMDLMALHRAQFFIQDMSVATEAAFLYINNIAFLNYKKLSLSSMRNWFIFCLVKTQVWGFSISKKTYTVIQWHVRDNPRTYSMTRRCYFFRGDFNYANNFITRIGNGGE